MKCLKRFIIYLDKMIERHLEKNGFRDGLQKLGINFMTASAVGVFITHLNDLTWWGALFIIWLGFFGAFVWIIGIYKRKGE